MNKYEVGAAQVSSQLCVNCPNKKDDYQCLNQCPKSELIQADLERKTIRSKRAKISFLFSGGILGLILGLVFLETLMASKYDSGIMAFGFTFGIFYYVFLFSDWLKKSKNL